MPRNLSPDFLDAAMRQLRDDSLASLLRYEPQRAAFPLPGDVTRATEQLMERAFAWGMRPTQENANLAAGYYAEWAKNFGRQGELKLLGEMSASIASQGEGLLWNAVMLPLVLSPDASVQGTAALDLCVLHPALKAEEFAGPRFVAGLALREDAPMNLRVASLTGALHLGDQRLHRPLLGIWSGAADDVRYKATQIKPGTLTLGFLEFVLTALAQEKTPGIYGNLAGLVRYYARAAGNGSSIVDIERHLPAWEGKHGPFRRREQLEFDAVRRMISTRLQSLCEREEGDPVMPMVLEVWGVDRVVTATPPLEFDERARRLQRADVAAILPQPKGSQLLIVEIYQPWAKVLPMWDEKAVATLVAPLAVLREIRNLTFLDDALAYREALSFRAGYCWPRDAGFDLNAFLERVRMDEGFPELCRRGADVLYEMGSKSEGELTFWQLLEILGYGKISVRTQGDPESIGAEGRVLGAFCIGYGIRGLLNASSRKVLIPARLPHQKVVIESALLSCLAWPRLIELPALARQGMANGLLADEKFDAKIRGQYFVDALATPLADAHGWLEWGLDAFRCASRAFAGHAAKAAAQSQAGTEIVARMARFYESYHREADGVFRTALESYMLEQAGPSPCPEAGSFDEISLAVDFGLWAAVVDLAWSDAAHDGKPAPRAEATGGNPSLKIASEAFPAIVIPRTTRPKLSFALRWSEIRRVYELPARLLVGDLDPTSFHKSPDGWTATYHGGDLFELRLSRRGDAMQTEEFFEGKLVRETRFPASVRAEEILKAYVNFSVAYDEPLKAHYESRYQAAFSPASEGSRGVAYFPDGAFHALLTPLPFRRELFSGLCDALDELAASSLCLSGSLRPRLVVMNYRERHCDNVPMHEMNLLKWTLANGFLPAAVPSWEGNPEDRAITTRSYCYVLHLSFPMRDGPEIVACLASHGVVAGDEVPEDRFGFLLNGLDAEQAKEISAFAKDRSRRFFVQLKDEPSSDDGKAAPDETDEGSYSLAEVQEKLEQAMAMFEATRDKLARNIGIQEGQGPAA
jgi:hypothetical protein